MPPPDRLPPQWRHRLFIAYAVVMLLIFLTPTPSTGVEVRHIDKMAHFGLFLGFALMFHLDRRGSPWRTFFVSAVFAAAVELVQWTLPFRDVEIADFVAGAAGAALATMILLWYRASIASGSAG